MKKEIYRAAVTGNVTFLQEARAKDVQATGGVAAYSEADLLALTTHGNNIIHIATEHGHLDFINTALENYLSSSSQSQHLQGLICGTNNDGDTPLHLAAKLSTSTIAQRLVSVAPSCSSFLWRAHNNKSNTPLHVALINGGKSVQVAAYLLQVGPEVASYTNRRKETPLHLAVRYDNQGGNRSMTNMVNKLKGLGASLEHTKNHFVEDSLKVIELLLEINATVCCLPDENGMTPLLAAAHNSYLLAVDAIMKYCPESVEICDPKGRTLLHHIKMPTFFEARKLLKYAEVSTLMERQDENGNTPVHIGVINGDYNMVKAMMECNANFVIKNNEGASAVSLIQSKSSSFLHKVKDDIRRINIIRDEVMSKDLFEAAYNQNWQYLLERLREAKSDDKHFVARLPDSSNIVHQAVDRCPYDYAAEYIGCPDGEEEYSSFLEEFIVEAPKKFPILSCQTDFRGGTPLHFAMYRKILKPGGKAFQMLMDHLRHIKDQPSCVLHALPPWETKDDHGNTLLHTAIKHKRYKFAEFLIELDSKIVGEINYNNETPLHILCRSVSYWARHEPGHEQEENDMVDLLLEKDEYGTMVYSYDADGLTPFLRAVKENALKIATRILHHCPQSIQQFDTQYDRSVFHLMNLDPKDDIGREFSKLPQMENLLAQRDRKGNRPLHLAIEEGRFGTAQILMERFGNDVTEYRKRNKDGKTALEVLANAQDVPRWFQDFLSSKALELPFGIKDTGNSMYGVRFSDMKEYMGPLGVVAALLTTITFTAAFTIPGGYDQNIGTPIMAKKVAFQVFMFTDVVGMCSSMMVLFCLLWFLNSGRVEDEGSQLVDLSIALLQLSFYATLLAFMMGVYVTTYPDTHWLAIFTCVLCCIVLILMKKRFILDFVVPVFDFLYFASKLCSAYLIGFIRWIACCLNPRKQDKRS